MTEPFVDPVRQEKADKIKNINKKSKSHIPPFVYQAHAKLLDEFPDTSSFFTPAFLYTCQRELCRGIENQLQTLENVSADIFGFGKFELVWGKTPGTRKPQVYVKFRPSAIMVGRIRKEKGTASEAELKMLERSKAFMAEIETKRKKYKEEEKLKRRGLLAPENPENYAKQFADILQASLF